MKNTKLIFSFAIIASVTALFAGIIGCEKDGSTGSDLDSYFAANPYLSDPRDGTVGETKDGMSITPATVNATAIGQQISFMVTGGNEPYTWGVATRSAGSVTGSGNRYGVYTVSQLSKNSVIASDASGRSAIASISSGSGTLAITPAATTFTSAYSATNVPAGGITDLAGKTINFQVTGGNPPYGTWSASLPALGTINASGVYTVANPLNMTGVNTISITDNAGGVATATVTIQYKP